ncbi:hypothetical protein DFJ74DRAFT_110601 [Hyaloraphidium curvatum]|nr:hypothetical protein DFJ74DRAFT_110601 [Hyaloraphidium curvatum]
MSSLTIEFGVLEPADGANGVQNGVPPPEAASFHSTMRATRPRTRRPSMLRTKDQYHPAAVTFGGSIQPFIAADVAFLASNAEWKEFSPEALGARPIPEDTMGRESRVRTRRLTMFNSGTALDKLEDPETERAQTGASMMQLHEELGASAGDAGSLRSMSQADDVELGEVPAPPPVEGDQQAPEKDMLRVPSLAPTSFPTRPPIFLPAVHSWRDVRALLVSRRNIHTLRAVCSLLTMLIIVVLVPPVLRFFGPESFVAVFVVALWDFTLTVGGSVTLAAIAFALCGAASAATCLTVALCSIGGTTMNPIGTLFFLFLFSFALWILLAHNPNIFSAFFPAAATFYFSLNTAILIVGWSFTSSEGGTVITRTGTPYDAYVAAGKAGLSVCISAFVSCLANCLIFPVTAPRRMRQEMVHSLGNISFIFSKIVEGRLRRIYLSDPGAASLADSAKIRILLQSLRFDFLTLSRALQEAVSEFSFRSFPANKYASLIADLQAMTTHLASLNACLDGFSWGSSAPAGGESVLVSLVEAVESSLSELRTCLTGHDPRKGGCPCSFRADEEDDAVLREFAAWSSKQHVAPREAGADLTKATAAAMASYLFEFGTGQLLQRVHAFRRHLLSLQDGEDSAGMRMPRVRLLRPLNIKHTSDLENAGEGWFVPANEQPPPAGLNARYVLWNMWALSLWMRRWETRFALKCAVTVTLITSFAFFPGTRQGYYDWRVRWAGISIFSAAAPTFSGDLSNSFQRVLGTMIGVALGIACWYIAGTNPYITCVVSFVFWYPLCWLKHSGLPEWTKTGALAAATYAIPFNHLELVTLGFENVPEVWAIGLIRGLMVVVGVLIVMAIGRLIWPSLARVQLRLSLSETVDGLIWLFRQVAGSFMLVTRNDPLWNLDDDLVEEVVAALQTSLIQERVLVALSDIEPRFRGRFQHDVFLNLVRTAQHVLDMLSIARVSLTQFRDVGASDRAVLRVEDENRLRRTRRLVTLGWMISKALRVHAPLPHYVPDCATPQRALNAALLADADVLTSRPYYGAYSSAVTEAVLGFQELADIVVELYGRGEGVEGQRDLEELRGLAGKAD